MKRIIFRLTKDLIEARKQLAAANERIQLLERDLEVHQETLADNEAYLFTLTQGENFKTPFGQGCFL